MFAKTIISFSFLRVLKRNFHGQFWINTLVYFYLFRENKIFVANYIHAAFIFFPSTILWLLKYKFEINKAENKLVSAKPAHTN